MKKFFRILVIFFFVFGVWFYISLNKIVDSGKYPISFSISEGSDVFDVADQLKKNNLIEHPTFFVVYMTVLNKKNNIRAQSFIIDSPKSMREISDILIRPALVISEKSITLLEGWTSVDMAHKFSETLNAYHGDFQKDFLSLVTKNNYNYSFLSEKSMATGIEGYLFPDTYNFYENATPDYVINTLLKNFDKKLSADLRGEISQQGKNIHDVIILASILEKEVRTLDDKKMVSDIFYSRMSLKMPLQADSTVNYVTEKDNPSVSLEDTQLDSAYNTYKNIELPPGPICNPGMDSIIAAIYPLKNDYLFFLTTLDDGRVIYSKTFEEHVMNKNKYLK